MVTRSAARTSAAINAALLTDVSPGSQVRDLASCLSSPDAFLTAPLLLGQPNVLDLTSSPPSSFESNASSSHGSHSTSAATRPPRPSQSRPSTVKAGLSRSPPAKRAKVTTDPEKMWSTALDLSRAYIAMNDLPPVPFGEPLSPEVRFAPCDFDVWPFVAPPPLTDKARKQFSHTQLLTYMDRVPFFSHTILDYSRRSKNLQDQGIPVLTPEQYDAYMDTEPWQTLASMLPVLPTTFTLDTAPPELRVFWDQLVTFNRENVRWYWERTHHLIVSSATGHSRKQRGSHTSRDWNTLTRGILPLIHRGIVDVDFLLEPAVMRNVKTAIVVPAPRTDVPSIDYFVRELDARWPERSYYLEHPDLLISAHPRIEPRISCKFDPPLEP